MFLAIALSLQVLAQTEPSLDYGDVYLTETQDRQASRLQLNLGYGFNISDSFVDIHSVMGAAQTRVWKYLSTGVFGLVNIYDLSPAGRQIQNLEAIDLHAKIPVPRWGIFSLSSLQFMVGKWNVLNLCSIESELIFGGGIGMINRGTDINGPTESKVSYLWIAEHRFNFSKNAGLFVSLLGHLDTSYLQSGFHLRFD